MALGGAGGLSLGGGGERSSLLSDIAKGKSLKKATPVEKKPLGPTNRRFPVLSVETFSSPPSLLILHLFFVFSYDGDAFECSREPSLSPAEPDQCVKTHRRGRFQ